MIVIKPGLSIPEDEISFTFSRSGGPGGQNVNKISSRVTLWFDVLNSGSLTDEQREAILRKLAPRINKAGILRVVSQRHRSQGENRIDVLERFAELLRGALRRRRPRKRTKTPDWAKERRLQQKTRRGRLKADRAKPEATDD